MMTPGPWEIGRHETKTRGIDIFGGPTSRCRLASVPLHPYMLTWNDERRANAVAIAAVPDLVAALRRLYDEYVVDMHGIRTCDCDPSVGLGPCAPCMARDALAKAGAPVEP